MISKRTLVFCSFGLIASIFPFYVLIRSLSEDKLNLINFNYTGNPLNDWKECVLRNVEVMSKTDFIKWPIILANCEGDIISKLDVTDLKWGKEYTRLIYNKTVSHSPLIISFGAGANKEDVDRLHKAIKHENFSIIGGFPLDEQSKNLSTDSSINFPEKVESQNRRSDRISMQYFSGQFGAEDFKNFLLLWKEKKFVDAIWLDVDAKEEEILPLAYRNDFLDQSGVIVCQWHVMVHFGENNAATLSNILARILQDERYAIFRPYPPARTENQKIRQFSTPLSLLLLNLENNKCKTKYSQRVV